MSYETRYRLTVDDHALSDDEHGERMARGTRFFRNTGWCNGESCSWYDHEKDMVAYSKKHPTLTFVLDGDGEDAGDIWRKWFRNGEVRTWKASVERPMDPEDPLTPIQWPETLT